MARPPRHTSYGGRADQAADSPIEAKPANKAKEQARERAKRFRERHALRNAPVTESNANSNANVTLPQAQTVTRYVTLAEVQTLAESVKLALGLIKSLETRMSAMERWAEQLEERFPRMRVAATPLQGTTTSVPASPRPGDMVRAQDGRMVRMPRLDADGQPIPE